MIKATQKHMLLIVCLILINFVLASCEEKNNDRFNTNDVSILVGQHRFTFPRNYSMSKEDGVLSMTLLMPNLQPRTRENEKFLEDPLYNKYIDIVLASGNINSSPSKYFLMKNENKKALDRFLNNQTIKYNKPIKVDSHLAYYEALSGPQKITIYDLYVYSENNDVQFILECPAKISKSTLGHLCGSTLNVFGNLRLKYWYPMQYLPNAFETHNKIKNLLETFYNGDKKE